MTVGELREFLAGYPDTMPVLIPGYETGWDALNHANAIEICAAPDIVLPGPMMPIKNPMERPAYNGAFERCTPDAPGAFKAVALGNARG